MTDVPSEQVGVPGRLGATARLDDGDLVLDLVPTPAVLHHGVVRASVLSFVIDCVAGIPLDDDPESWSLTTDLTVRTRAVSAPRRLTAVNHVLRRGGRSASCRVEVHDDEGTEVATGAIGFARVRRRPQDPPKQSRSLQSLIENFGTAPPLTEPLRTAAGIEVVDAAQGIVEVPLGPHIRNSAGTLQGAMAALVAEAAAEDLLAARSEREVVVTDLDVRFLDTTGEGPVRTRARLLGTGTEAPVVVELVDVARARVTALAHLRATACPPP